MRRSDTIKDKWFPGAQLFLGRQFLKNTSTIQEHDIKVGVTLNAFIKKAPKGFASLGEYLSARKLKHGKIKISRVHSHLHRRTESVVMAESSRLSDQAKEYHKFC